MSDDPMRRLLGIVTDAAAFLEKWFPAQAARVVCNRDFDAEQADAAMDWLGWAVPAILTELSAHQFMPGISTAWCSCDQFDTRFYHWRDWMDHVAPLIAARIGCDPARAIEALKRYRPDKV